MSDEQVKTFNIHQVKVSFAGFEVNGPWAEDDGIQFEFDGESWNEVVGMKGGVVRGHDQGGRHGNLTLSLLQGSPALKLLNAQHELDTDVNGSGAPAACIVRSVSEGLTVSAGQAYIKQRPNWTGGKGAKARDVVIRMPFVRIVFD